MLKNYIAFIVLLSLSVLSCNNHTNTSSQSSIQKTDPLSQAKKGDTIAITTKSDTTKVLLVPGYIKNKVLINHAKIINIKGDLSAFKQYLKTLDTHKVQSIAFAMDYIKTCITTGDSLTKDSIFLYFRNKFYDIANAYSDSIYGPVVSEMMIGDTTTDDVLTLKNNLSQCGVGLFFTEGSDYFAEQPDYFYTNFKDRVSAGVKKYLSLRKVELKEGFSEDAGLLIGFDGLYKRVKNWETFLANYPNCILSAEVQQLYATYLETLLTGMDNSRVFDLETNVLTPEMKILYGKIMKDDTASRTTKIVSSYYTLLSKHNFIGYDSIINPFIKNIGLSSMIGIQPNTR